MTDCGDELCNVASNDACYQMYVAHVLLAFTTRILFVSRYLIKADYQSTMFGVPAVVHVPQTEIPALER
jgi:hypothetical protein